MFASAWLDQPDRRKAQAGGGFTGRPDVGFYLDPEWGASTILASPGANLPFVRTSRVRGPVVVYPWEDWGVPESPAVLKRALGWLLKEIAQGKVVEVGCIGGHGRTGTTLAYLLVLQGMTANKAIDRIWSEYCEEAIESQRQIDLIKNLAKSRRRR